MRICSKIELFTRKISQIRQNGLKCESTNLGITYLSNNISKSSLLALILKNFDVQHISNLSVGEISFMIIIFRYPKKGGSHHSSGPNHSFKSDQKYSTKRCRILWNVWKKKDCLFDRVFMRSFWGKTATLFSFEVSGAKPQQCFHAKFLGQNRINVLKFLGQNRSNVSCKVSWAKPQQCFEVSGAKPQQCFEVSGANRSNVLKFLGQTAAMFWSFWGKTATIFYRTTQLQLRN